MAIRKVVCLVIDRLHAAYLGAYGNTWVRTPTLDRLAAESFVFDRAVIDTPDLGSQVRSLWEGKHVLCPTLEETGRELLPIRFANAGMQTAFMSDTPELLQHPLASAFAEQIAISREVNRGSQREQLASSAEETEAAEFFASAIDWISSARQPYFLWLHTGTLGNVWDAPLEYREQYADEDDPEALESAATPNLLLPERFDPDALLGWTHAYAGQVTLLDELISSLLESLENAKIADDTLFVLQSARGFPLGEHRRVGPCDEALYAELTHAALIMRFPSSMNLIGRSQALIQPADVPMTLLDACGLPLLPIVTGSGKSLLPLMKGETGVAADRAFSTGPKNQRRVETSGWSLRMSPLPSDTQIERASSDSGDVSFQRELFVKPDDWFEVNEVTDRCEEIAEKMRLEWEHFAEVCRLGELLPEPPLPVELTSDLN